MALLTVEGIYRGGKVELVETPAQVAEPARVLVTFLTADDGQVQAVQEQTVTVTKGVHESREVLRQRAFAQMEEGIPLGGPPYPKREELYDRFSR